MMPRSLRVTPFTSVVSSQRDVRPPTQVSGYYFEKIKAVLIRQTPVKGPLTYLL